MSPAALALVLTAALLHATWNLAAKRVTDARVTFIWLYVVLSAVIWVPVGLVWVAASGQQPTWSWLWAAAVSAALHLVYQLVLQRGYAEGELNLVYPLARGSGPLLTFMWAAVVLGQRPGPVAAAGVLAIAVGILLIALGLQPPRPCRRRLGAADRRHDRVVHAVGQPLRDRTRRAPGALLRDRDRRTAARPGRAPVPRARPDSPARGVARCPPAGAGGGGLLPLAYILVLRAMQLAPVALVAAGREASIVVGAVFGWLVLHEPRPARRLVGAAVVLAGIALIAVS